MIKLKPLRIEAVPAALQRAMRYRLLNESRAAESICLDILEIEPDNQEALVALLLSLTDQFSEAHTVSKNRIQQLLNRLDDQYERCYYRGIVCERRARTHLNRPSPGSSFDAFEWLRQAMEWYEKAEAIRPEENDEAILRWNTCVRIIQHGKLKPRPDDDFQPMLE